MTGPDCNEAIASDTARRIPHDIKDDMTRTKAAIDPLWQCLCPAWASAALLRPPRVLAAPRRPSARCANAFPEARRGLRQGRQSGADKQYDFVYSPLQPTSRDSDQEDHRPRGQQGTRPFPRRNLQHRPHDRVDPAEETTTSLYHLLRSTAVDGKTYQCRQIVEYLVKSRGEKPSLQMYNALILSNQSHDEGTATRVMQLLEDLKQDGFEPDTGTCHAVLKVLAVHVDHLLRTDVLHYMAQRWFTLSDDGAHDVAAGLFREGLFEQGLRRLEMMHEQKKPIQGWLLDMAIYTLGEANEMSEAYRIMRQRFDSGETNISRSLWMFFLDKASAARHEAGTALVWANQVKPEYINPSSGICLNVLSTASQAGDAVMATEVFTHLSKRGTAFKPIHYELLINAYLSMDPPDVKRALSILTIMPLEKIEPSTAETRSLFWHIRDSPLLVGDALATLRDLHGQGRKIPIASLNLLIESYVHQGNLSEALKIYKQIHTFVPIAEGAKKSFANIETFNLLLKGCRVASTGPDAEQASFLVSELLALRVRPTSLTYDRLILVFVSAARHLLAPGAASPSRPRALELLDWAFRHFADMQPLGWLPRFGTLELLAVELARAGDARCWDALQAAEDAKEENFGWGVRGQWVRGKVEAAWAENQGDAGRGAEGDGAAEDGGSDGDGSGGEPSRIAVAGSA